MTKGGTSTTKKSLLYSAVVYSLLNSGSIIGHEKVITLVDKLQQERPNCIYESVWKDNIMPIAKRPTGETHLARVDKVYSMGVSSILKLNTNKKTPIRIDNIIGLRIIFFTNTKN